VDDITGPPVLGVLGVDYDVDRIARLLRHIKEATFGAESQGVVTMFAKSQDKKTIQLLASTDKLVDSEIAKKKKIEDLNIPEFTSSLSGSDVSEWVQSATLTAASYAQNIFEGKQDMRIMFGSNQSSYFEDLVATGGDNSLMVSMVQMDDGA